MNIEFETVAHIEAGMTSAERISLMEALIGGSSDHELTEFFNKTKFTWLMKKAMEGAKATTGEGARKFWRTA